MKVNHKSFTGGYRFRTFEGQPQGKVEVLSSKTSTTTGNKSVYERFMELGLTSFGGPTYGTKTFEGHIASNEVTDIVINAIAVEPYSLPIEPVLTSRQQRFVDGLKAIKESFPSAKVTLAFTDDTSVVESYVAVASNISWLDIVTVDKKYPINLKELLIPTILGKKFPVGYRETHINTLVLSINDVLLAADDSEKVMVAVAGSAFKEPKIFEVALGTPVKELIAASGLAQGEVRLIKNSVLRGDILDQESVVTSDLYLIAGIVEDRRRQTLFFFRNGKNADSFTNAFLSALLPNAVRTADTNIHGERRACVSCTYCQQVCPVGLIPHLLHKYVNKEIYSERLAELKIFDCINCGLCDYVCPSKIHVAADIQKGKNELEKVGFSHEKYQLPGCDMTKEAKEVEING